MADTWIKVEYSTIEKIEVAKLATALGMDPYTVLGRLVRIWSYFDLQSRDGRIDGIDANFIDRMIQHPGFCEALAAVGWMQIDAGSITLPSFDRHNGGGAKIRAQGANRQSKHRLRGKRDKSNAPRNGASLRGALPEEGRGEDSRQEKTPPSGDAAEGVLLFGPDVATSLAKEFTFAGGEPTSASANGRARAVMKDLLAAGLTPDAIRDELNRPGRRRSEHPGDLCRRLLKGPTNASSDPHGGWREAFDGAG
jgi:hypothetical protein